MMDRIRQLTALGIFGVLFCALLFGLGPSLSARLVLIGEEIWEGYAQDLRYDPDAPECDLQELESKLESCPITRGPSGVDADEDEIDPFADEEDPFAEEADPFAEEPNSGAAKVEEAEGDPFVEDDGDPFAEEPDPFADPSPEAKEATAEADPFLEDADDADPFDSEEVDPFAEEPSSPRVNCVALGTLAERCSMRHAAYADVQSRLTPGVRAYRSVELAFGGMAKFPYWKHMLILLTLLGAISVTMRNEHIALREVENQIEHRISQTLQLTVHRSKI